MHTIRTQVIPVTLLQDGDWYYPVVQSTGEVMKDEGMHYIVKAPRIDRNTGAIYAVTDKGRIDWQNGATVAREVHTVS
jgi:hypothetical protein